VNGRERFCGLPGAAWAGAFDRCAALAENVFGLRGAPPPTRGERRLRVQIWNLRRTLRTALARGVDRDLVRALQALARNSGRLERAAVVWIDLIEVLVQSAERRYGRTPGMGKRKAAEVKEALHYLMRENRFSLPNVPPELEPVLYDLVVNWTIDTVVLLLNRYGLWEDGSAPAPAAMRLLWRILAGIERLFRPLWTAAVRFIHSMRAKMRPRVTLSPEVKAAVDAVTREGLLATQEELVAGTASMLKWVAAHRDQLLASFELVFAAVNEAELVISLSGPEKKHYARDLVWAVLDDLGFRPRSGLLFALVDAMIDVAIEASVRVFHKRGVFTHRGRRAATPVV
jgi:hypothetical protein